MLRWTQGYFQRAGLLSPRLDAELLLAHCLGIDRVGVYMAHDRPLSEPERSALRSLVSARARGKPVAYLTGHKEFYGLDFRVGPGVLVPRPETEHLVDAALELLKQDERGAPRIADVGTGAGAIACSLAAERSDAVLLATELAPAPCRTAAANAQALGVAERLCVLRADLLTPVRNASLDLVVSNPPYLATGDPRIDQHVVSHEPALALFAGQDGLAVYRRLLPEALRVLRPGGHLVLELGEGQREAVAALTTQAGLRTGRCVKDLAGIDRVLCAQAPA